MFHANLTARRRLARREGRDIYRPWRRGQGRRRDRARLSDDCAPRHRAPYEAMPVGV
jgi:hypothetical protein